MRVNSVSIYQGKIYAATTRGLSFSTDDGNSWTNVSLGCNGTNVQGNCYNTVGIVASGSKLNVGVNNGLMTSPDGGTSWQLSQPALNNYWSTPSPSSQYLFVAAGIGILPKGFSYSSNGGSTWTYVSMQDSYGNGGVQKVYATGGVFYALTAQLFSGDIQKSSDQGSTWSDITPSQLTSGAGQDGPTDFLVVNNMLYASSSHGIFVSNDGGQSWSLKTTSNGLAQNAVDAMTFDGTRIWALSYTYPGHLAYSLDNGTSWNTLALPANLLSFIGYSTWSGFAAEGNRLVIAGSPTGIAISTDSGATWSLTGQ